MTVTGTKTFVKSKNIDNKNIYYQGYVHKGIVLNVEDFGGYIEIAGNII
jgi:hypothetical protein